MTRHHVIQKTHKIKETGKLTFCSCPLTLQLTINGSGVIESSKTRYGHKLLSESLYKLEIGLLIGLRSINILDVIYKAAKSYEEKHQSPFVKSWRKFWPNVENNGNNPKTEHNSSDEFENDSNKENLSTEVRKLPDCNELLQKDVQERPIMKSSWRRRLMTKIQKENVC